MQYSLALTLSPILLLLFLGNVSTLPLVDLQDEGFDINDLDVDLRVKLIPVVLVVEEEEEGLVRNRRDVSISGNINKETLNHGVTRDSGHISLTKDSDPHSVTGTIRGSRLNIPGAGSSTTVGLGGQYGYEVNDRTKVSIGGFHDKELDGRFTSNSGILGIEHNRGKHDFAAGVEAERTDIPGHGSSSSVGANVGYKYNIDKDTSFTVGGRHNSNSGTSGFIDFTHYFGRK